MQLLARCCLYIPENLERDVSALQDKKIITTLLTTRCNAVSWKGGAASSELAKACTLGEILERQWFVRWSVLSQYGLGRRYNAPSMYVRFLRANSLTYPHKLHAVQAKDHWIWEKELPSLWKLGLQPVLWTQIRPLVLSSFLYKSHWKWWASKSV